MRTAGERSAGKVEPLSSDENQRLRLQLRLSHDWGPRLASRLRKEWVKLRNPLADIRFGPGSVAGPGFSISAPWGGRFHCGANCEFRRGFIAELAGPDSTIEIGNRTVFTYHSLVQCAGTISVGDDASFGQSSMLVDGNHRFRDLDRPVLEQGYDVRPIRIDDEATTMTKCTIIADIGRHAIVGANAVVLSPVPAYTVAVGVPARVVDYFGPPGQEPEGWEGDG